MIGRQAWIDRYPRSCQPLRWRRGLRLRWRLAPAVMPRAPAGPRLPPQTTLHRFVPATPRGPAAAPAFAPARAQASAAISLGLSPRMSLSIMARRSTTCSTVPCTASSESSSLACDAAVGLSDIGNVLKNVASRHDARCGGRVAAAAAQLLDVNQQIGEPALDPFKQPEPRIRNIEPLDQTGDAVLEMRERGVIGMGELHPFELLDQAGQKLLQLARHRMPGFGRGIDGAGERVDAVLQRGQRRQICRH